MQPGAEEQRGGAADFGIEPGKSGGAHLDVAYAFGLSVPPSWLVDFTDTREDFGLEQVVASLRSRERLAEDVDLVTWLALHEFAGRDFERFAEELCKYGVAVMVAWIRRGQIFARCRDRGLGGLPEPPIGALDDLDVARELAYETVTLALVYFREKVLVGRRWDPARGATLKTYFIGQCLYQFANVYRYWLKHETPMSAVLVDDVSLLDRPQPRTPRTDPAELAVIRAEIETRFTDVPERSRKKVVTVMVLTAAGWDQEEIAAYLGITVKAVERTLAYHRSLNRKKAA